MEFISKVCALNKEINGGEVPLVKIAYVDADAFQQFLMVTLNHFGYVSAVYYALYLA